MTPGRLRQFITEERTTRLQSFAIKSKALVTGTPGLSPEEARRRRDAALAEEEFTEGRVHRSPPAPVNYHEL